MNEFSFDTIENFDEHIDLSIPNYSTLVETVIGLSRYFVQDETSVVDIGCSTGKLLEAIHHNGRKIGVDVSDNLLPKSNESVEYINEDLATFNDYTNSSLVISLFTLQFIDQPLRQSIINRVANGLVEGGAFIMAEKIIAPTGKEQEMFGFLHYDHKLKSFEADEILAKERTLRRIMRPITSLENKEMVESSGLANGMMLWKFLNFEAWLYIKPKKSIKELKEGG